MPPSSVLSMYEYVVSIAHSHCVLATAPMPSTSCDFLCPARLPAKQLFCKQVGFCAGTCLLQQSLHHVCIATACTMYEQCHQAGRRPPPPHHHHQLCAPPSPPTITSSTTSSALHTCCRPLHGLPPPHHSHALSPQTHSPALCHCCFSKRIHQEKHLHVQGHLDPASPDQVRIALSKTIVPFCSSVYLAHKLVISETQQLLACNAHHQFSASFGTLAPNPQKGHC